MQFGDYQTQLFNQTPALSGTRARKMKTSRATIGAIRFENGHILLASYHGRYIIQFVDGDISEYNREEMKEVYNYED